jgi:hypothetical protein
MVYRPIAHDVTAPAGDDASGGQISNLCMHNITFVNEANFVKLYNNTRTDIVREHLEDTLRIRDVSAMGLLVKTMMLNTYHQW